MMKVSLNALSALLCVLVFSTPAAAYTTRVHISFANDIREALIASGDGTIDLMWSEATVQIPMEDAQAIINEPLAFRAGSIGPDNFVFPAMTDGTHALGQNPYGLCEVLYLDALTEEERAYALGCFLHGTGDAIAHHVVNSSTGETFTLNPTQAGRAASLYNVVGHIVTEALLQEALLDSEPDRFSAGAMAHAIPMGFVGRNFHDIDARLWQEFTVGAMEKVDRERAADPDANLAEIMTRIELAPWEYIALAPLFVAELQTARADLRDFITDEIADLQDPASSRGSVLLVEAGDDGALSTEDDTTSCTATCPELFARYKVMVGILLPRTSAGGAELPSAFDTLSGDLERQLNLFLPALRQTISNLSAILNEPLMPGESQAFDLSASGIDAALGPMNDWAQGLAAIDYQVVADAVTPNWYLQLERAFLSVGVDIRVASIIEVIFQPIIDNVLGVVRRRVIDEAHLYLNNLKDEIEATKDEWVVRIQDSLRESAPRGFGTNPDDDILDSGIYAYTINFSAATLANHNLVLAADEIATGPASFDASYSHHWTQAGLCDYLRPSIFPEGITIDALLSLRVDGELISSGAEGDAPVECHDGSLFMFGEPSVEACEVVTPEELAETPVGSVTRSYPPLWAAIMPRCLNIPVPGLPDPPDEPLFDAGPGFDGGAGGDGGALDGGAFPDADVVPLPEEGCSCTAAGSDTRSSSSRAGLLLILLGLFAFRRRRSVSSAAASVAPIALCMLIFAGACGDDDMMAMLDAGDGDDASMDAFVEDPDAGDDSGIPFDAVVFDGGPDAGDDVGTDAPDLRRELLDALGDSVWSGLVDEDGSEVALQMQFSASSLEWALIRNPFGPGRLRELRAFNIMPDGLTVSSTVLSPSSWPPNPRNGTRETWEVEVIDGSPRMLRVTNTVTAAVQMLEEGEWPAPESGLTAEIRVFGSSGPAFDSFCGAGINLEDAERRGAWEFARGRSAEDPLGMDTVAGAPLFQWDDSSDGANDFSAIDVHGFDQLGGTALTAQFNFMVRYEGFVRHPGGSFSVREEDDSLEDALWVFADENVGSSASGDLLLEVHNWFNVDATPNPGTVRLEAGDVPIEIILVRCAMPFAGKDVLVQASLAGAPWTVIGDLETTPIIDVDRFPPAL